MTYPRLIGLASQALPAEMRQIYAHRKPNTAMTDSILTEAETANLSLAIMLQFISPVNLYSILIYMIQMV